MLRKASILALASVVVLVLGATGPTYAKYRYGQYAQTGDRGFFLFGEGMIANPRNVDAIVATTESLEDFGGGQNSITQINPTWEDEFAGRLGVGYEWASGNRVLLSFWGFSASQSAAGSGNGVTYFAIGPPIQTGGGYAGNEGSPGSYSIGTDVEAATADVAFARVERLSESFTLEWSVGLRYARYEETSSGFYDEAALGFGGLNRYDAAKSIESDMFGVRASFWGSYRFARSFSLDGGLGFSFLDGEQTATSSLTPSGTANTSIPSSLATIVDDSRSGNIRTIDLTVSWWLLSDALRLWFGWEQQIWDGVPTDLVRNFPGTLAPLRDRDSVTFSMYKIGVFVRF